MKPRLVIDMNLSRAWESFLAERSYDAVHWSRVGDPRAKDAVIMAWARGEDRVVFTNDLDFGAALALTNASGPSVVQVRALDVRPQAIGPALVAALEKCTESLTAGALVILDADRMRLRSLPLRK